MWHGEQYTVEPACAMIETFGYLETFGAFPLALRRLLRRPITPADAHRIVTERLERRDENFLGIAERSIYDNPGSPYRPLLKLAGCELPDLCAMVRQKGLERALAQLRAEGVFATFEEFKGRKPIVRQGRTFEVKASDFDNPAAKRDFTLHTGGSTGLSASVYQDLDYIAAGAPHQVLMLEAWNVLDAPAVHWNPFLPGAALRFILQRAAFGKQPHHWFSPSGWLDSKHWVKYGAANLYMIAAMRACGIRIGIPEVARLDRAGAVANRIREALETHGTCLLYTNVSRALRVAIAAEEAGWNLRGATFRVGGEPVTAARIAHIARSGARVMPVYGAVETGAIGLGCPRPNAIGQTHLASDGFALITSLHQAADGTRVPALNLTTLMETSSKVMLNYEIDDYAVVGDSTCGCSLHRAGYTLSIGEIRSYSKLVGEGVTLLGTDMLRILDDVLPARFGGTPLDYQLMQTEDGRGLARLHLVVSPRVHIADEGDVIRVVLDELRRTSSMADVAGNVWRQAGTLHVARMEPVWTSRGKLPALHVARTTPGS
jgi:hypothetical protein